MADSNNEGFTFNWKIENFSMLPHQKGVKLASPSFTVDILAKAKLRIWLYPRGDSRSDTEDNISCFLWRDDLKSNPHPLNMCFSFALESTNDRIVFRIVKSSDVITGAGILNFVLRSYVIQNKHFFLPQDVLTIRCRIWPFEKNTEKLVTINDKQTDENGVFRKQCSAITRIEVQRRSFTWSIPKINQHEKSQNEISIITESSLEETPSLKLSVCFNDDSNNDYFQVEILQTRPVQNKKSLFVKCKITVLSAEECYQDSLEDSHLFSSDVEEAWHFPEFLKMDNLVDERYVIDNTLFLHFEFAFSHCDTEYHLEVPKYVSSTFLPKPSTELSHLSGGIRQLFVSRKFCDVTLRAGKKSFPCHKVALCAQSPVFSAMFESDMKEKNTGVVDIKDLDPKAVERMLAFIHSDVMDDTLSTEDTCKLYEAADEYQILPLKWKCSLLFLSSLSVKSVCDVLACADRYQDYFLLANVHNFLSIHASETFHSPEWEIFMDKFPKFSGEIMLELWMKKPL